MICRSCGAEFKPRQPYHCYCDACYAARAGQRTCASCGAVFTPKQAHYKYCESCYSDKMAEQRSHGLRPRNRQVEMWTSGAIVVWVAVAAVPAMVIYGIGKLAGWW